METLEAWPEDRRGQYPWDTWLDGQIYRLVRGEDFRCGIRAMGATIRRMAYRRVGARVKIRREGPVLTFQVLISPLTLPDMDLEGGPPALVSAAAQMRDGVIPQYGEPTT